MSRTYYPDEVRTTVVAICLALAACSSAPDTKQTKKGPAEPPGAAANVGKHPLNKYIEVLGFRMAEQGAGKLKITFAVINHSEADIGDLGLKSSRRKWRRSVRRKTKT
jgi:hypothetical protein